MLIREQELKVLKLSALEKLAANCPACFAPPVVPNNSNEPDMVVCIDGNFQHKRHMAAGRPIPGLQLQIPELFLTPDQVETMRLQTGLTRQGSSSAANALVVSKLYEFGIKSYG